MASYNLGKQEVCEYLKKRFIKGKTALDVGACDGKWFRLLGDYFIMNGIEPFKDNIAIHNLDLLYNIMYLGTIQGFNYPWYDLVILGDVIEHMTIKEAKQVIKYALKHSTEVLIAVPYLYEQDELYGNPFEKHLQPDLTHEIFMQRYKGLQPLWQEENYGYYIRDTQDNV